MAKSGFLSREEIANNIRALQTFMSKNKIDVFYLSSNDIFLNEYVPLSDCHRYYVTGFTGSTAECLVPRVGKVQLFVDGRYHEQADLEVDLEKIEVVKVEMSVGNRQSVLKQIAQKKYRTLAFEANRIDVQFADSFKKNSLQIIEFHRNELQSVIPFQTEVFEKKLIEISTKLTGESTLEKLRKILKPNEAFFITALDSIAWLTNMRRYELPFQSTFKSKALATYDRVYLLMEGYEGKVSNPHVEIFVDRFEATDVFLASIFEVEALLGGNKLKVETLYFSEALTNESDAQLLKKLFKSAQIINKTEGIIPFHAYKNPVELESIKASFNLADQAIFNTLKKVKNQLKQNLSMTEKDLFNWCNDEYQKVGALAQSFNTIAGVGANSSIIHYSASSDQVVVKNETLMLLDSGGYLNRDMPLTPREPFYRAVALRKNKKKFTLWFSNLYSIFKMPFFPWEQLVDISMASPGNLSIKRVMIINTALVTVWGSMCTRGDFDFHLAR